MGDEIYGDVKKSAYDIPQNVTPVPGGIGPTEMAILAERLVQKSVAPELEPWSSPRNEYLSRERVANLQSHWAQNIYPIARKLLSTFSPSSQVSGDRYQVSFDSDSGYLSIDSLDERGTIVEYDNRGGNGVVKNILNDADNAAWSRIEQSLSQIPTTQQTPPEIEID